MRISSGLGYEWSLRGNEDDGTQTNRRLLDIPLLLLHYMGKRTFQYYFLFFYPDQTRIKAFMVRTTTYVKWAFLPNYRHNRQSQTLN